MQEHRIEIATPDLQRFDGLFTYAERGFAFLDGYVVGKVGLSPGQEDEFLRTCRALEESPTLKVLLRKLPPHLPTLRWMAICSSARSRAYQPHVDPHYHRIFRDYYFAAYFVGIKALIDAGAKAIGITNLCANPRYAKDEVYCAMDAIFKQPNREGVTISILDPGQPEIGSWAHQASTEATLSKENLRPIAMTTAELPEGDLLFDITL